MFGNIVHPEAYTHSSKVGSKKYSADIKLLNYCEGNTFAFHYKVLKKKLFHVIYHNFKIHVTSVNITENNMRLFNKREYKTLQSLPCDRPSI